MKITLIATLALASLVTSAAYAEALTEQQIEGVQSALKAAECTAEDNDIRVKDDGYKVDDAQCKDGTYDIILDQAFAITKNTKSSE